MMKKIRILAVLVTVLAIASWFGYSISHSLDKTPKRGIASVDDKETESSTEDVESDEPASPPAAATADSSVTKYMSPADFIASLTRISATDESRPASLSNVIVSFVPRDSIYYANFVNYNLGGTTSLESVKMRKLILAEFGLYPTACLQRLGLRHLITAADITIAIQGALEERTATLDAPNGIMTYGETLIISGPRNIYLDYLSNVARVNSLASEGRTDREFLDYLSRERLDLETRRSNGLRSLRAVISNVHHEFYHYWDIRDDNSLTIDSEWTALNPAGFSYGDGGRFARGAEVINWNNSHTGFLNGYSRAGLDEDKAEIWGALMAHSSQLEERMRTDPVIARKVALIKRRAESYCPEVNTAFWEKVQRSNEARIQFLGRITEESNESVSTMPVPSY